MDFDERFDEKIDVIDLIINVLKEHEKTLDELIGRLEQTQTIVTPPEVEAEIGAIRAAAAVKAILKNWLEFRNRCEGAKLVAVNTEGECFKVSALANGVLHIYEEKVPDLEILYKIEDNRALIDNLQIGKAGLLPSALKGKLDCGIEFTKKDIEMKQPNGILVHKIIYYIEPGTARSWVAYQLGVNEEEIFQGELQI
jgi:hypothetical protein